MPQIIKPRTLAFLAKTERRKVGASYIVTAMGLFDLARPDAERFETEQALWVLAAEALPKGSALDIGMPKPQAELLVAGSARPPNGEPASAMIVQWTVGPLQRRLLVSGDRYWTISGSGYVATEPKSFTEMPLVPERAFGGQGHPDNPVGVGFHAADRLRAHELVALPNVESAEWPIRMIDDRPPPALCGPTDLRSQKRLRYAGTYDSHWLKNVAPALPPDVDPRLFLFAPDEQVFPGYLVGGEPYVLHGFSADQPELRGTLPAFKVRCFLARKETGGELGELVEIAMRIDTLWLFAGARRGVLIYRGALPVNDVDAEDISEVMLAYERQADEPRSIGHYAELLELRRDRKQAYKYAFAESQLAPPLAPETVARRDAERAARARETLERQREGQAWFLDKQLAAAGIPEAARPALPQADIDEDLCIPLPTEEELAEGDIDLDGIEALERKQRAKAEALGEKADAIRQSVAAVQAPGAEPGSVDALFAALDALSGGETAPTLDARLGGHDAPSMPNAVAPDSAAEAAVAAQRAGNWRQEIIRALASPPNEDETDFEAARAISRPPGGPTSLRSSSCAPIGTKTNTRTSLARFDDRRRQGARAADLARDA